MCVYGRFVYICAHLISIKTANIHWCNYCYALHIYTINLVTQNNYWFHRSIHNDYKLIYLLPTLQGQSFLGVKQVWPKLGSLSCDKNVWKKNVEKNWKKKCWKKIFEKKKIWKNNFFVCTLCAGRRFVKKCWKKFFEKKTFL